MKPDWTELTWGGRNAAAWRELGWDEVADILLRLEGELSISTTADGSTFVIRADARPKPPNGLGIAETEGGRVYLMPRLPGRLERLRHRARFGHWPQWTEHYKEGVEWDWVCWTCVAPDEVDLAAGGG